MTVPAEEDVKESKEAIVEIEVRKPVQMSIEELYAEQLSKIPGIERIGPVFKTTLPIDLTEAETEYRVRLLKHVYARHVILQFECVNTLSDQQLEQVIIKLEVPPEYEIKTVIPCQKLVYDKPGSVFVIVEYPCAFLDSLGTFVPSLEFVVRDCDPTTGVPDPGEGYADSYPLEDFEMSCSDQIRARAGSDDWEQTWDRAANAPEASDTFVLSQNDINDAAKAVCEHLGLPKGAIVGEAVKEIRGGGIFRGGAPVLVRARLAAASGGVTMKLAARSPREDVAQLLLAAVG